ncbi:MAG: methylenetetrahydrofolate reductase [NAD(P)H] [Proteobacteria bacterium]|nr:methylenetetrahydrofolate reductase [NAD(P)H] [Pseudomonadota bacterium]
MPEPVVSTLSTLLDVKPPTVSFEFFPPKTPESEEKLWLSIKALEPLNPAFVSVTYGAGGSTRERTHHTLQRILKETKLKPAAHLTCVAATKEEINTVVKSYWDIGVKHIVALRGDMPGGGKYVVHPGGYPYAVDLVSGIKKVADFEISVAAYPEVHPDALSPEKDLDNLKRKLDAGANRAITQYFFDTEIFLRFRDKAAKAGIKAPIVPGIIPVASYKQIVKFSAMCGTSIPAWLTHILEPLENKPELHKIASTMIAAEQCRVLMSQGEKQFHFYTLNHADHTAAVCHLLNKRG